MAERGIEGRYSDSQPLCRASIHLLSHHPPAPGGTTSLGEPALLHPGAGGERNPCCWAYGAPSLLLGGPGAAGHWDVLGGMCRRAPLLFEARVSVSTRQRKRPQLSATCWPSWSPGPGASCGIVYAPVPECIQSAARCAKPGRRCWASCWWLRHDGKWLCRG